MKLFSKIRGLFSKGEAITTPADLWKYFFGGAYTSAGISVTQTSAMRVSTVFSCVRVIAESMGVLPCKVYRRRADGKGRDPVPNHPVQILINRPNDRQTWQGFVEMLTAHAVFRGNGYAFINWVEDPVRGTTYPMELIPIHPDAVKPIVKDDQSVWYRIMPSRGNRLGKKLEEFEVPSSSMFHLHGISFDGVEGVSILDVGRETLGIGQTMQQQSAKMYGNGTRLSGVLEHPQHLGDGVAERIREQWEETFGGSENAGKTAVLEEGMTYKAVSMTAEQAEFLESRKFNRSEIAGLFRVPPHKVGDLDKATFSNIEHMAIEFVTDTLLPWVRRWELSLMRDLVQFDDFLVECNLNFLLRGDVASRYRAYAIGRQWGWLSVNDVRAMENLNPIADGGDVYLQPLNMVDISDPNASDPKEPSGSGGA